VLAVPVVAAGRTIGSLHLHHPEPANFSDSDLAIALSLACSAGGAIERRLLADALDQSNQRAAAALAELEAARARDSRGAQLRALGQLASGIAHDLNNALAPVVGYAELLRRSPEAREQPALLMEYLDLIHTGASDAASVVARLREHYRAQDPPAMSPGVEVRTLLEQVVALTRPKWRDEALALGRTVTVAVECAESPAVVGDGPALREALINLVLNAVDAMPRGGALTLRAAAYDERVVVEVADTGTGMTERVRQRCLEPFSTTKGEAGSGLGLTMVHRIVERHGGRLDIRSELGRGTTVAIWLATAGAPQGSALPAPEGVDAPVSPASAGKRILVVDDEPGIRSLVTILLERDGHTVEAAEDGRRALARFAEAPFDVVITDRAMPELNGDHVAAGIKEQSSGTPVIMLTGFADVMLATGEQPAQVDAVLSKPFTLGSLRQAIASVSPGPGAATTGERPLG
jgi:signal transduction histidine kinase/ActR/RegA family two-component response regulator